jgi:hypothetical protein
MNFPGVKTDIPYSNDIIQSPEGVLMAENCFGSFGNKSEVKLRKLDTGV